MSIGGRRVRHLLEGPQKRSPNPTCSLQGFKANALVSVTVLSLMQFFFFGALVGKARAKLDVKAPSMNGPEAFERLVRVHLNTMERLVMFVPLLWMAGQFWNPLWVAAAGVLFLVGLVLYWRGYVRSPEQRSLGNVLTIVSIASLLLANFAGLGKSLLG
jgi:glutathione S-transferase